MVRSLDYSIGGLFVAIATHLTARCTVDLIQLGVYGFTGHTGFLVSDHA